MSVYGQLSALFNVRLHDVTWSSPFFPLPEETGSCATLLLHIRVATIAEIGRGKTYDYKFTDGVEGQFVTLALSGSGKYLTLCEVEVYGYRAPTGETLS